jgi:hypothetical protein
MVRRLLFKMMHPIKFCFRHVAIKQKNWDDRPWSCEECEREAAERRQQRDRRFEELYRRWFKGN